MFNFIFGKTINIEANDIIKEGWLTKQSKYQKEWRDRWCVLTNNYLYSFKEEKVYKNPTEELDVHKIKTIRTEDGSNNNTFKIELADQTFLFRAKEFDEKESWIGAVGKVMVRKSNSNLFIKEDDD